LQDDIFIFGHSFDESDKHIFDEIKISDANSVYVSIFGSETSDQNIRTMANAC
jgi:hypothetical protein